MARKLDRCDKQEPSVSESKGPPPNSRERHDRLLLNRRTCLELGAAAVSALSIPTIGGARSSGVSRDGIEFHHTQNAVADLGMDPTGREPIDAKIDEARDGDLIRFPEGSYRFESDGSGLSIHNETRGFESIGERALFVASSGTTGFLLDADRMDNVYFEGINIDQRATNSCLGIRLTGGRVIIRNVELLGGGTSPCGGVPLVSHATSSVGGDSLFENIVAANEYTVQPPLGRPGIFVEQAHEGTVTIRDCDLRRFPNAAVHAVRHSGRVHVANSSFRNNASAIRLSNSGSSVTQSRIELDELPPQPAPKMGTNPFLLHGVSLGKAGVGSDRANSISIEDSSFQINELPIPYPAVTAPSTGCPLEIVNCDITYNNASPSVITSRSPGKSNTIPARPLELRNTVISGTGDVDSVVLAEGADRTKIKDSSLQISGSGDGITIRRSDNCTIERTAIDVAGRAAVFTDTGIDGMSISDSSENFPLGGTSAPDEVTIEGTTPPTNYEMTIDGSLEAIRGTAGEYPPSGGSVEGQVGPETDEYSVDGGITDFRFHGGGTVYLNGDQVDPASLTRGYPHRIVFDGDTMPTTYAFTAERLSPKVPRTGGENQVTIEDATTSDACRFGGALDTLSVQGDAEIVFEHIDTVGQG